MLAPRAILQLSRATRAVAFAAGRAAACGSGNGASLLAVCESGFASRAVHTSCPATQKAKKKKGGKSKGAAQGTDKLYYTRVELPSHQAFISNDAVKHTFTDADGEAVAAANQGSNWTPESRRCGAITLKCGMTADWDTWGQRHPLTVLKLEDVRVTQVKTPERDGFHAVQVGGGDAKPKRVTKPLSGHFAAAGVTPKIALAEFPVTDDAVPELGSRITARHFVPGQYVDVTSVSIGKGFQGPMKRWGFGGQSASHGTTKAHRSHGSTGSSQNPGRVFKGKKMAGRMGGNTVTVECLQVYKVDVKRDLLYLRGSVPGHAGTYVRVRDSLRKPHSADAPPPFPTYVPTIADEERARRWAEGDYDTPDEVAAKRAARQTYEVEPPFELLMPSQSFDPFGIHDWEEPTMD